MANKAKTPLQAAKIVVDSFKNFVANINTSRDKQSAGEYYLTTFSNEALSVIYRTSWMGRKAVDIPAKDATRKWREWRAEAPQIEVIEEEERRLQLRQKVLLAMQQARLYGGAGIYFSIDGDDPSTPFQVDTVGKGKLAFVTVLSKDVLTPGEINADPLQEGYGKPMWYDVTSSSAVARIHPSRVCVFIGNEVLIPQELLGANTGWGDSILQSAYEAVRNADAIAANVASLVYEAKIDVLQIPNLANLMASERSRTLLEQRVALAARLKSNNGMLVIDAEEEYNQKTFTYAGLSDINYQALQAVAGASDIPLTRFLGQSPAGLTSTGESDLKNYYDSIASLQSQIMTPALHNLDEALIRSALGSRPDDIFYEWSSLWQMSDEQKSKISKETAETISILAGTGLFPEDVLAEASVNLLVEHSIMPTMEFEPVPEEEEEPQQPKEEQEEEEPAA